MALDLAAGIPTGIGSLPHRDPAKAAAFVLAHTPELPAVPTLPRRSPSEAMIAQAVVGIDGITVGQYGNLAVASRRLDPAAPVSTPLDGDAFEGMRAFLAAVDPKTTTHVKWQIVGPVTLGLALVRAGVKPRLSFDVAAAAVSAHVEAIQARIAQTLPDAHQVVFLDEPMLTDLQDPSFPIAPATAIDAVSEVLAAIESFGTSGVHCCGEGDWAAILSSGPGVLSLPVRADLVEAPGCLDRFLGRGGWIAWGVIDTDGPIPMKSERPWRTLTTLWCGLVRAGVDPDRLVRQSIVTPACGLYSHADGVAARVFRLLREISDRIDTHQLAAAIR